MRGQGGRSRIRDIWRWSSLLPYVGALPMCVVMARRGRPRWALGAGVVTALWLVVTGIAGGTHSNATRTAIGLAIFGLYVVQVVLAFVTPQVTLANDRGSSRPRRAWWLWLSVIPMLGTWLPALAGLRARVWWWVLLGLGCEGITLDATVQLANHAGGQGSIEATKLSALLSIGWLGGVCVSMLIRPVYARRVHGAVTDRRWPVPTERARTLGARYALGAYFCAVALIAALVTADKASKSQTFVGVANIVGETLTLALLLPLIRSRHLRPRDFGIRRTLAVPGAGYAVLALVGYLVVIEVWVALIPQTSLQAAHKLTAVTHHPGTVAAILIVVALAVFAPICEEVFFRGMLYRSLRNRMSLWPAAVIAGSLFGLIHIFAYPISTIPVKIAFGIFACLLYERTGSLLPGIAAHSFVDGTAADVAVTGNPYVALAVYAVLLLAVLLRLAKRRASPITEEAPMAAPLPGGRPENCVGG